MLDHEATPNVAEEATTPEQTPDTGAEMSVTEAGTLTETDALPSENSEPGIEGSSEARPSWHIEAGRKGGHRVHQLIQEGKLYEKEHGLKRGRQRLRQLIELGKRYEQDHELGPRPRLKRNEHLRRRDREEVLTALLQCLVRMVKPSFRSDITRLLEALRQEP